MNQNHPVTIPLATPVSETDWILDQSVDAMDNTPTVTVSKSGTDDSRLVIRCEKHKTEAFIATNTTLAGDAVRIKFDQGSPIPQSWARSENYRALFAPDAIEFSRELAGANTFLFEFTPFQEKSRTIRFDVSGLKEKLQRVSEACDWAAIDASRAKARTQAAAAAAAWRAEVTQTIHRCWRQGNKWCYFRPDEKAIELGHEDTREEALDDALRETQQE